MHCNGKLYAPCRNFEDASSSCPASDGSPITTGAKADRQKTMKACPHGTYSMLLNRFNMNGQNDSILLYKNH